MWCPKCQKNHDDDFFDTMAVQYRTETISALASMFTDAQIMAIKRKIAECLGNNCRKIDTKLMVVSLAIFSDHALSVFLEQSHYQHIANEERGDTIAPN